MPAGPQQTRRHRHRLSPPGLTPLGMQRVPMGSRLHTSIVTRPAMVRQIASITALLFGMGLLLAGGGLHGILIPVRGQMEGFSNSAIGWIGAGYAVGFTAGCLIVPHVVRRVGHIRAFSALTAVMAANMLICAMLVNEFAWLLLRLMAGFSFAGCYMIAESWLNERVSNAQRGMIFSIYAAVTQGGMMAGQFSLTLAEPSSETLFMLGAILYALALVPTAITKAPAPAPLNRVRIDVRKLFTRSPAAFVGALIAGTISSAWSNFAPIYGGEVGLSNAGIASLLAVAMVGAMLLQVPIGRLSDLVDRRYAIALVCVFGAGLGFALTALTTAGSFGTLFYVVIALYGGAIYSVYALIVAHANDYAEPGDFVETASGMLILYGFGTMIGPLVTAQLIDATGPVGVFTTTTVAHGLLCAYALYRTLRRPAPEQSDFGRLPVARTQTTETYALDPRADETADDIVDGAGETTDRPSRWPTSTPATQPALRQDNATAPQREVA